MLRKYLDVSRMFCFLRHGLIDHGESGRESHDAVSAEGVGELSEIAKKLKGLGFSPTVALSTIAVRCQQTARILAPELPLIVCEREEIPCFWPQKPGLRRRETEDRILESIAYYFPAQGDVLVVSHDSMPTYLGARIIELTRGTLVDVDKFPDRFQWIEMGHGVLVQDKKLSFL